MPLWRLWYLDGSVRDSSTPLSALPRSGVLVAVYNDEDGLCTVERCDWFILHKDNTWTGHDKIGLATVLAWQLDDVAAVLTGVYVRDSDFKRAHLASINDPDFPLAPRVRP